MSLKNVGPGENIPAEINVIVEIPAQSGPVKYEVDKDTGVMEVDRFMATPMYYPCNYGYVPKTLSEDGDPVDVLVVTPVPLIVSAMIKCRPIGVLGMADEKGEDNKVLAVPTNKLASDYAHIQSFEDISPRLLASIVHFFEHYKDLEEGKWVKIKGWQGVQAAQEELVSSVARFNADSP